MRSQLLIIGLLLGCFANGQTGSPNDTLHWGENRKLAWSDFKGEPLEYTGFMGESFCMMTANFERPTIFSKTNFKVYAIFDRTKSWVSSNAKSDNCLLYFQIMFNLYELNARKLRKDLSETKFGADPNPLFQEKYNNSMTALTNEFNEFRKETKMGQDNDALVNWDKKVRDNLKLLENFK
jgi:hypothetical protein